MEILNVSDQIIAVLDALCAKFGVAVDWTASNIIPYLETLAHKLVAYELATSIAWIGVWLIPFMCSSILLAKMIKSKYSGVFEYDETQIVIWLFFIGSTIVFALVCATQLFDIIACITFPEKIILREVQYMMRTLK